MRTTKSEVRSPKSEVPDQAAATSGQPAGTVEGTDFWNWGEAPAGQLLRDAPLAGEQPPFDLQERTARFAEAVIRFARTVPRGPVTNRLIDQVVGAGSSIAANYAEATDAVSRKDFMNRVGTSRKESKEAMLFLRLIATAEPPLTEEARTLWREARELNRILGAIWRKGQ